MQQDIERRTGQLQRGAKYALQSCLRALIRTLKKEAEAGAQQRFPKSLEIPLPSEPVFDIRRIVAAQLTVSKRGHLWNDSVNQQHLLKGGHGSSRVLSATHDEDICLSAQDLAQIQEPAGA